MCGRIVSNRRAKTEGVGGEVMGSGKDRHVCVREVQRLVESAGRKEKRDCDRKAEK